MPARYSLRRAETTRRSSPGHATKSYSAYRNHWRHDARTWHGSPVKTGPTTPSPTNRVGASCHRLVNNPTVDFPLRHGYRGVSRQIVGLFGLVHPWVLVAAVLIVAAVFAYDRAADRAFDRRRELDAIASRADAQHRAVQLGYSYGTYGAFPPGPTH